MNWKTLIDLNHVALKNREIYLRFVEIGLQIDMAAVARFLEDDGQKDELEQHLKDCKEWGIDLSPGFESLRKSPTWKEAAGIL